MARTLQAAALPRIEARQLPAGAALAALGIVYGDIGTSPLYAFKQAAEASGTLSPETIMGIVSVILWSLIVIVSFKYAILIMRAGNRGEGGIFALLALLDVRRAPAGSWRASLLIVGLVGAALLYGDGVITPAISVLTKCPSKVSSSTHPSSHLPSFRSAVRSWLAFSWSSAKEPRSSATSSGR
jgi:KUP system potassium uptake protein